MTRVFRSEQIDGPAWILRAFEGPEPPADPRAPYLGAVILERRGPGVALVMGLSTPGLTAEDLRSAAIEARRLGFTKLVYERPTRDGRAAVPHEIDISRFVTT